MKLRTFGLYPLKFYPILKEKIWGGTKLRDILHKPVNGINHCGESWEISGVPGNISVVAEGPLEGTPLTTLIETYKGELVGEKIYQRHGLEFPLLIKFLDAAEDLSFQVHPDDSLARERHNSPGKTEMWYIIQAEEGARIFSGFNRHVTPEAYLEHVRDNKIGEILNQEPASAGDTFFIPAGRVHTIGKGILLAEIQQTSDVTYRIYDFDREDEQGNKRELHTEAALAAIDFNAYNSYRSPYSLAKNMPVNLARCPYFCTNKLYFDQPRELDYSQLDSFVVLIGVEGATKVSDKDNEYFLHAGETLLIPASCKKLSLTPESSCKLLETYIPLQ